MLATSLLLVAALAGPGAAEAAPPVGIYDELLQSVRVSPEEPGPEDPVTIEASGTIVVCIFSLQSAQARRDGDRVVLEVVLEIPPALCPGFPQKWLATAGLDPLPPGTYRLDVVLRGVWEGPLWERTYPGAGEIAVRGGPAFRRGDCADNGVIDLADAIRVLELLFLPRRTCCEPPCVKACDTNGDGMLDIGDAIGLLNYLFAGGPQPAPPFEACGWEDSALSCAEGTPGCP